VTTVDVHAHLAPPSLAAAANTGDSWQGFDVARTSSGAIGLSDGSRTFSLPKWSGTDSIEQRLQRMDATGVDVQALSVTWRMYQYDAPERQARETATRINEDLSAVVAENPGRFWGLAQLPLQDPAASIRELERWMAVDGMVGAAVGTDVNGVEWDDPSLFPVLEAAESLGALVFFHPADRQPDPRLARFHLRNLIGNPLETTVAIAALVFGGVLDRLPRARLCFAHAGGFAALGVGRFDHGYRVRPEAQEFAQALPSEYLRRLYFDTITHSELALRHLVDLVGAQQVVMGSDDPADMGTADPVSFVENCASIPSDERRLILGDNLVALVKPSP
jgi:aminocarboxymuconate-semialdehyde decarboxylase